jgi:hypothetical protein
MVNRVNSAASCSCINSFTTRKRNKSIHLNSRKHYEDSTKGRKLIGLEVETAPNVSKRGKQQKMEEAHALMS